MGTQAYRYRFREDVDILDTEVTLHLAIIAAEGLYGEARVRMDAAYALDETISAIVVDASTAVGQVVCAMFTHFLLRQYGSGVFHVCRVEGVPQRSGGNGARCIHG
jgi:hypothetical protein